MAKVRCRFCEFEVDQRCEAKKGSKVKVNKKRSCQSYKPNEEKILNFLTTKQNNSKPKVTMRPDGWWSRDARRAERDKAIKQEMDQYQTTAADSKHPTTGDLSRFTQHNDE
jgi:hypothetical protein